MAAQCETRSRRAVYYIHVKESKLVQGFREGRSHNLYVLHWILLGAYAMMPCFLWRICMSHIVRWLAFRMHADNSRVQT